jgi:hypothetical protein
MPERYSELKGKFKVMASDVIGIESSL